MQFEDSSILAVATAGVGAAWGGILAFFSIKNKQELHELQLLAHTKKMEEIEAHMDDSHSELKTTVMRTEMKLDRLIERFIPQQTHIKGD
jgi:hypothetical protein